MHRDPVEVADFIRWAGVLIAFIGALVASPSATARVWVRFREGVLGALARLRGWLARWVPWLRRSGTMHGVSGTVSAMGSVATMSATGVVGAPRGTIEDRVLALETRVVEAFEAIGRVARDVQDVRDTFTTRLSTIEASIEAAATEARAALAAAEKRATDVDVRALPLVVFGVILSGLAEDATRSDVVLAGLVVAAVAGLAWAGLVAVQAWRARPSPSPGTSAA